MPCFNPCQLSFAFHLLPLQASPRKPPRTTAQGRPLLPPQLLPRHSSHGDHHDRTRGLSKPLPWSDRSLPGTIHLPTVLEESGRRPRLLVELPWAWPRLLCPRLHTQ
ncbi:hypothetical protein Micbo1qcDRAFT_164071 [Microdochium bolleyi]|uniref:Uncharacterized protein n=1 Tax=Microdochium bolleyi TaxID=196109 RepID=A0A136IZX0_9PEZI|nr:hypothetical protein Micbo1qcDRAFT_164071 [Microdochium bolleyi]